MPTGKLFLSHSWSDKDPLQELRKALEGRGLPCFEDARELRAGDRLLELEKRVRQARGLVVLLSTEALKSKWVRLELEWARAERAERPELRIVALVRPDAAELVDLVLREDERLQVPIEHDILDAVPRIVDAFSAAPLSGRVPSRPPPPPPRSELVLRFRKPRLVLADGTQRVHADLELIHQPAEGVAGEVDLGDFRSPLGPIELGELAWYLEVFPRWAFNENLVKGRVVEGKLPIWGQALYAATLGQAGELVGGFRAAQVSKRVVVEVRSAKEDEPSAAAALLALPWELLRDEDWLFAGADPIRVVRRLPRTRSMANLALAPRLRVLLVVARSDDAGFIDARASLTPLVDALRPLGHKVEVDLLPDGTLPALERALQRAQDDGRPYQVVHFDGHGVYDPQRGLGLLVFEHPEDAGKLERRGDLVDAETLGAVLARHRVPLFVLEACQTGQGAQAVESSVAGRLLRAGVGSVVAMSHSVLVETARRFVAPFYRALVEGRRIGTAMVRGQQALFADLRRNRVGQPDWTLQDWFVPLLFQDAAGDVALLPPGPLPQADDLDAVWRAKLADTPTLPGHGFVGRARELLALHRLLHGHRSVALLGIGGQGKTALAIEAARWLLAIGRFERLTWVSVEHFGDARVVVDALGRQLVAGWNGVAAIEGPGGDLEPAIGLVERALTDWSVLVVVDNLESVLSDPDPQLISLLARLARTGESRLLLTSRELPPESVGAKVLRIGPLSRDEGRELVAGVLRTAGLAAPADGEDDWIGRLVEVVRGHPRSLVLLAPRVAERGLRGTVEDLGPLLEELERDHPGNRQNSLLASVRLSLDKLPGELRQQARALCVFRGAAQVSVLALVARVEPQEVMPLCQLLVALGLAEAEGSFLLFELSLPAALGLEVGQDERVGLQQRWLQATAGLVRSLYQERYTDAQLAATGTRVALAELLALVEALEGAVAAGDFAAEAALDVATSAEALVALLGRPKLLRRVVSVRRRLGQGLGGWSHARFEQDLSEVERQLEVGDWSGALAGGQALLRQAEASGDAYAGADYDLAMATWLLGRVLQLGGRAGGAVPLLERARRGFQAVEARRPGRGAARMAAVCVTDRADALRDLGKLDEAAAGYQEAIELAEARHDRRNLAVNRGQLGTVRMLQRRYGDALGSYRIARQTMTALGEDAVLAKIWHMEAVVHQRAGDPTAAEHAFLASLDLKTRLDDRSGQAKTLLELGTLYASSDRSEQAADFCRRACDTFRALHDDRSLSLALNNLAATLSQLHRYDEARAATTEAIHLKTPYGHAAAPWTSQAILANIEAAADNPAAAAAARTEAIRLFRSYRDDGGSPTSATGRLVEDLHRALATGVSPAELVTQLPPLDRFAPELHPFRHSLAALLQKQPIDLDSPSLSYTDAAELQRLQALLTTLR